jgi:pectate lyase
VSLLLEENATGYCSPAEEVESEHLGFAGDGYVNTVNAVGSRLSWAVSVPTEQEVTLTLRYASATSDRPARLLVDGAEAGSVDLAATGAWTTWATEAFSVELLAGEHLLTVEALTDGGLPNIDSLQVEGTGLAAATCPLPELPSPVCTPGAVGCADAETPELCSPDGQWVDQSSCAYVCDADTGSCAGSCVPGTESCLDANTPQLCNEAGALEAQADCPFVCSSGACTGSCVPGSRDCSGNIPRVCSDSGSWESQTACATSCVAGSCTTCVSGARQCLDANTPQLCVSGSWQTQTDCAYLCASGNCTGSCVPGSRSCQDGNTPRLCDAGGNWVTQTDCAYVCTEGVCGGSCAPGTKRCSGSVPETCSASGSWTSGAACANGCSAGVCQTSDSATVRLDDPVPGWASIPVSGLPNGTTGGGTNAGAAVTVDTMAELQSAASGSTATVILVEPGTYTGTLTLGSNKTIIGKGPGVKIQGNVKISGSSVSNIILRNFAIRGNNCSTYDACRAGADALAVENGAHHVWLDHLDIADGQDGNCDFSKEADYITVSFTKFSYTYAKEHRFSNLISSSDTSTADRGKLRITYMMSWWGERVNQRMPRGRFGKVHLFNNYFSSEDSGQIIHGPGVEASYIVEGCYYDVPSGTPSIKIYDDSATVKATGNAGTATGMNQTIGSVFAIPYAYTALPASEVKARVTATSGGAGNTCSFSAT